MCRKGFELTAPTLVSIGKGEDETATAYGKIRAVDILGKYGFGKINIFVPDEDFLCLLATVTSKYIRDEPTYKEWTAAIHHAIEQKYQ